VQGEKIAGLAVVFAIFISAMVALYETIMRFVHPEQLSHLSALAAAGVIGFLGNELAAQVRLGAGRRLPSAAMIADGKHARTDGFVSLGVVVSAIVVALGVQIADPIVGLVITLIILHITWESDALRTYVQDRLAGAIARPDGSVVAGLRCAGAAVAMVAAPIGAGRARGARSRSPTVSRSTSRMIRRCGFRTRRSTSRSTCKAAARCAAS
jgi:hypothetical protein